MLGLDRPRVFQALVLLATALFLLTWAVPVRHRRALRWIAVAVYLCLMAAVLAWVGLWLAGVDL